MNGGLLHFLSRLTVSVPILLVLTKCLRFQGPPPLSMAIDDQLLRMDKQHFFLIR